MAKYQVEINEILSRIIGVEAENENDAVSKIKDLYRKEEIVLDSNGLHRYKNRNLRRIRKRKPTK